MHFGDVFLHFVEFTGEEGDVAVALPVDQALRGAYRLVRVLNDLFDN